MSGDNSGKSTQRRLQQLEKSLAICERERALVAYELHDGLVQQLAAASMMVDAAAAQLPDDPGEAANMIDTAASRLRGAMEEARRLMRGIRPPALEAGGLPAAVEEVLAELKARQFDVQLTLDLKSPRLAPVLETAALRILQEALNNVERHSGVSRARVLLREHDDCLELEVHDAGRGFDPQSVSTSRFGVRGIRDRATLLGGSASVCSQPGCGTIIAVRMPLQDPLLEADGEAT